MSSKTAIITHSDCMRHEMGPGHPECPERLGAIIQALKHPKFLDKIDWIEAYSATREQLYRVHQKSYVDSIFSVAPTEGYYPLDPDTIMNPYTLNAALYAAGAMIKGVDLVFTEQYKHAFCAVRPPGHHAEPDKAMGFCLFNNIAVGVAHALAHYHCRRVAIIDFDVHHGNGTESMFINEPRVFFWSSFQHPFYPGTVLTGKPEHIHLCPLDEGTKSLAYRHRIVEELVPQLKQYKPECIFISAGFDAHKNDPLANIQLNEEDYYFITQKICEVADKCCKGRVVSTLEGGYDLPSLADSVAQHVFALTE